MSEDQNAKDAANQKSIKRYFTKRNIIIGVIVFIAAGEDGRAVVLGIAFIAAIFLYNYKNGIILGSPIYSRRWALERRHKMLDPPKASPEYIEKVAAEQFEELPKPKPPQLWKASNPPLHEPVVAPKAKSKVKPPAQKGRYSDGPIKTTSRGLFGWLSK